MKKPDVDLTSPHQDSTRVLGGVIRRKYVYVRAEAPRDDLTMVSFSHVLIQSSSETMAYVQGSRHFKLNPPKETKGRGYRFLNDYVIAL